MVCPAAGALPSIAARRWMSLNLLTTVQQHAQPDMNSAMDRFRSTAAWHMKAWHGIHPRNMQLPNTANVSFKPCARLTDQAPATVPF